MSLFRSFPKLAGNDISNEVNTQIKDFLESLKQDLTTGLSAFYMGNANKGTNDKTFQSNTKGQGSKASILGDKNSIYSILEDIKNSFDMSKAKKNSPFRQILDHLKSIENSFKDKAEINQQINVAIEGLSSESLESLIKLAELDTSKDSAGIKNLFSILQLISTLNAKDLGKNIDELNKSLPNLAETVDSLADIYNKIGAKFANAIQIGAMSDQVSMANEKIKEGLKSCEDVAVDAGSKKKEVVEANITMKDMGSFMWAALGVMSIGALFVMMGGGKFIMAALKFGATLALFEAMVLAPILLIAKVKGEVFKGLKDFSTVLITCTTVMLIGALFMMLGGGKMVKAALMFGITLGIFESLVIAPFILFKFIEKEVLQGLKSFSSVLIVCTTVMLIGALFMSMGGGKFVLNALAFGFVLMAFEALVIAPFILFNKIDKQIFDGLKSFSSVIFTCTVVLLVGALFMTLGGGKMVVAALEFTALLMTFEAAVIAPFLLFNLAKKEIFTGMKDFALFLAVATGCLLVGSLFMTMKGGKMPLYALEFTGVLGAFILAVSGAILPLMIWGNPAVMAQMKQFTLFIGMSTACLVLGSWFVSKYGPEPVVEYGLIFSGFVWTMSAIASDIATTFDGKTLVSLDHFTLFVTALHAILITGALYIQEFGGWSAAGSAFLYAGVFSGFVWAISKVSKEIVDNFNAKTLLSLDQFSIFVGTLHAILITGGYFMKDIGPAPIVEYGLMFWGFSQVMGRTIAYIHKQMKQIQAKNLTQYCIFLGTLHAILVTGALFMDEFGAKPVVEYGVVMSGFTIVMSKALVQVSKDVKNMDKKGITQFCIFLGTLHAIVITGALFVDSYGVEGVLAYEVMFSAFVAGMSLALVQVSKKMQTIDMKSILGFCALVGLLHIVLITGVLFMEGHNLLVALAYAGILGAFVLEMGGVFHLLNKMDQKGEIKKGTLAATIMSVGIAALGFSVSMVLTMTEGQEDILGRMSALCLIATEFGVLFRILGDPEMAGWVALGALVMVAVSASIGIFGFVVHLILDMMKEDDDVLGKMSVLCLIAAEFGTLFGILGAFAANVALGSVAMLAVSAVVFIFGNVVSYIVTLMKKYPNDEILEGIGKISEAAGLFSILFGIIGIPLFAALVTLGAVAIYEVSQTIGVFGSTLSYVCDLMKKHPNDEILSGIGKLSEAAGLFSALFGIIGIPPFSLLISIGSSAISNMSIALSLFGEALDIVSNVYKKHGDTMDKTIEFADNAVDKIDDIFKSLAFSFTLKSGVAIGKQLGVATKTLMEGLMVLAESYKKTSGGNDIIEACVVMEVAVKDHLVPLYKSLFIVPVEFIILKVLGMRFISKMLINIVEDIITSVNMLSKVGDISSKIDLISDNINSYFEIPNKVTIFSEGLGGGILGALGIGKVLQGLSIMIKLSMMEKISEQIANVIGRIGDSIYKIASLQIPNQWDENGNPIHYRQLKARDFDLAAENTGKVLTTMAQALVDVYNKLESDGLINNWLEAQLTGDELGPIGKVLNVSNQIATVVGNVGESIGNMAKMQIPIEWDEHGKPIKFRTLKPKDFTDMSTGVNTVLTSVIGTLAKLYADGANLKDSEGNVIPTGGRNIFDSISGGLFGSDDPSPIEKVLGASFQVGEMIANIGEGVAKIAKLQIPIKWDPKTGKVTNYRTLKTQDFTDMGIGVGTILGSIFTVLGELANDPELGPLFKKARKGFLGLGGEGDSKIELVIGASVKVSQLIANLASGISKMATMQIPKRWNPETGVPIEFVKLTGNDFIEAGNNIGLILTNILTSLQGLPTQYPELFNGENNEPEALKMIMESILPVGELIGNMAEGIVKLAGGQVPYKMDPKTGHVIEYKQITAEDYTKAGEVVGSIITSISNSILDVAQKNPELFFEGEYVNGEFKPDYSSSNEAFGSVVGSFSSMSNILSGMSDAMIKLGQGQVADRWDKQGNPIHFKDINFSKVIPDMEEIIEKILISLASTTITIYRLHKDDVFSPDSTFAEAVQAMNGTVEMMSKMADTVIKIGSSKIPYDWDDKGNPTKFKDFDAEKAVSNTNYIFSSIMGAMYGTIGLLIDGKLKYYDKSRDETITLSNPLTWERKVEQIQETTSNLIEMYSKMAHLIISISSEKIPTALDKDGKPTKYQLITGDTITKAQDLIKQILCSFAYIIEDKEVKKYYYGTNTDVVKNAHTMEENVSSMMTSFDNIITDISKITEYEESMQKIFKYPSTYKGKITNAQLTIPFFRDIYGLLLNIGEIMSAFNGSIENQTKSIFESISINDAIRDMLAKNKIQTDLQSVLDIISGILKTVSKFDESYFSNKSISQFMKRNESGEYIVVGLVNNILSIYKNILGVFSKDSSNEEGLIGNVFGSSNDLSNMTSYLTSICQVNEAISKLMNMSSMLNGIGDMSLNNDILTKVSQLKTFYTELFDSLAQLQISDAGKSNLYWITSDLQRFISIVSLFNTQTTLKSTKLKSALTDIYTAMNNQTQSKIFIENTKVLGSYVKTINSVNVQSTNALTELVKQLNLLGLRLGNIDRLTDALANKLAEVLKHLVERLDEAKETINKADELQEKRKSLIEASVTEIRGLLEMPLQVNIKPEAQNPDDNPTTPST